MKNSENKDVVADLGLEGGGATICRRKTDDGWVYWNNGSSIAMDENDDETWREWRSEETPDLGSALPSFWPLTSPTHLSPEYVPWFREAYQKWLATDSEDRKHAEWQQHRWKEVLGLE